MFFIALIAILIILAIKLFYNHLTYGKAPLEVLDNKYVEIKIVKKYLYKFKLSSITPTSALITTNEVNAELIKTTPGKASSMKGTNRSIILYNQGPQAFTIKGISYFAKPRVTNPSAVITATKRKRGETDADMDYLGGPIELLVEEEIQYDGLSEYDISRLLISTDNADPRKLTLCVYDKSTAMYSCVTLSEFDKNFLLIDLFN